MSDRQRLLELLTRLAYEKRKVTLSSGRESDFYLDTKQASLTAEGHVLVGRLVMAEIRAHFAGARAVGGMTMGADPIASAAALTSFLESPPGIPAFYVRKEPKGHGTQKWMEGRLEGVRRVIVVDDVWTTGGSTVKAVEAARASGMEVVGAAALVDREQGARSALAPLPTASLFTLRELLQAKGIEA